MKQAIIAVLIALAFVACKTDKSPPPTTAPAPVSRSTITMHAPSDARAVLPDSIESGMVIPDQLRSQPPSPGPNESPIPTEGEPSIYPGSIPTHVLLDYYVGLAQLVSRMLDPRFAELAACKTSFLKRGAIDARVEWTASIRIIGDGTQARVADVQVRPDAWPPMLDEEARTCVLNYLKHAAVASTDVVDATVDFPMCFTPTSKENE